MVCLVVCLVGCLVVVVVVVVVVVALPGSRVGEKMSRLFFAILYITSLLYMKQMFSIHVCFNSSKTRLVAYGPMLGPSLDMGIPWI